MLRLWLVGLLHGRSLALPATQSSASCAHDKLFSSLSSDGQEFCYSMVKTHCEDLSTPPSYASYPPSQLSSYCECVLTSCSAESSSAASSSSGTGNGSQQATATSNDDYGMSNTTSTSTSATSTGKLSGTNNPENTRSSSSNATQSTSGSGRGGSGGSQSHSTLITQIGSSDWSDPTDTSTPRGSVSSSGSISTAATQSSGATPTESTAVSSKDPSSTTGDSTISSSINIDSSSTSATSASDDPSSTSNGNGSTASQSGAVSSDEGQGQQTQPTPSGQLSAVLTTITNSFTTAEISTLISPGADISATAIPGGWNATTSEPWGSGMATGTGSSSGFMLTSGSGVWNTTSSAVSTTSPSVPFVTPVGFNTSTLPPVTSITGTPTLPAANFTQVSRTAAIVKETCYHMPSDVANSTKRVLLHNTDLRERNATIPFPYIESIDFASDGIKPLFLTLRDAAEGTHYIDVSNKSLISIVDSLYNAMILDADGIHFSTVNCQYDVSITIKNMYQQLAQLSGKVCSAGSSKKKRLNEMDFTQGIYLRDQCNNPVKKTVRNYPNLKIGDTDCNDIDVNETSGLWSFDCSFPGTDSGNMMCHTAVKQDIEEFLFTDPFGGSCPDLSTIITTLEANAQDFINSDTLRTELYNQGLNATQKGEADLSIMYYEQLWEILQQAFSKLRTQPAGEYSNIAEYINTYNQYRNFEDDVCDDLHAADLPLKMSLQAGVTYVDAVAKLNWAPQNPAPYNVTIQDPAQRACCSPGSNAVTNATSNVCSYSPGAYIKNTGCVCGNTASGASVAFEITECENFVSQCESDADCAKAGHATFACLTGSCCGGGVCADPYECAQNGTSLVNPTS